ncbi:extracellular solute-binding protein [Clostridium bowmanii]|uniref:extracellular solute-binding protein n=1 Tax=Clostridium bowmanii TaxID=132925 RepID=UPI001C0B670B|nr:extracellular solute-binding protein [Clostridium bowmanii]MBU3189617.1 extracellular solute-binding protein [Clostridium bowmanii]MCA1073539.1 extracellular solute-binding protein [Clostridium bowmanii]
MNRKIRVLICSILSTIIISSVFVGCGKSSSSANGNTSPIVFWNVFTGADGQNMTKLVAQYNATNPKIKIKNVPMEQNDLYAKLPSVVLSGKAVPDLTIVHAERIPLFVEDKMLMPLDKYITANGNIKEENYVSEGWKVGGIGGNRYSVPLDVHSYVSYYNKDLMAKYGPHVLDDGVITMDEVREVGLASKKDKITGMSIGWMRPEFLALYEQLGGELSADGTAPTFSNEKGEKVLNDFKTMVKDGIASQDGDDPGQLFKSGKLVIWPEGIWMANSVSAIKTLNWGMTHFITYDANKKVNWSSSHQFTMFKNSKMNDARATEIMKFIAWIGDNSIEWARSGQVPASLKILKSEEFQKMPQAFLLKEKGTQKIFNYKYYGYATEALDKIVTETVFDKMDVKKGLDQAVKETQDRIKASKK